MEIINIEKSVFDAMVTRFNNFASRVEQLCNSEKDKSLNEWLDMHDVCRILQISVRTLQNYRDRGLIGYSQIGHKIFYRKEEVVKLLKSGAK